MKIIAMFAAVLSTFALAIAGYALRPERKRHSDLQKTKSTVKRAWTATQDHAKTVLHVVAPRNGGEQTPVENVA